MKRPSIIYTTAQSEHELKQILSLQRANLPQYISDSESKDQGFVTVEHSFDLLSNMQRSAPQVIALDQNRVVGYALVMLPSFADQIPVLIPMFDMLATLSYHGKSLHEYQYYVMGQVCIDKD